MDLRLLETFLTVCEAGSFSAAADRLGCVQSNVTARIRRLEDRYGRPAFDRGRGGARLTAFGARLKSHAEDLLTRAEAADRALLEAAGAAAPLRLGSMETTAAARLPALLKDLRAAAPDAPISLRTGPTAELTALVWDRKLDAAFVAAPVDADRFAATPAFEETLCRVSLAGADPAGPMLVFRNGCSYRATAEAWARAAGHGEAEILELGGIDGVLGCVAAGMGFAVIPDSALAAPRAPAALRAEPLPAPFAATQTLLIRRRDEPVSQALEALIELL